MSRIWDWSWVSLGQAIVCLLLTPVLLAAEMPEIEVHGLFKDRAFVSINGEQHVLKQGETIQGVTLVSADSQQAVVSWEGRQFKLSLSRQKPGRSSSVKESSVSIPLNNKGQYLTTGSINDLPVTFLVDTGATMVAMSSTEARRLDLQYETGKPGEAVTAGGRVRSWSIILDRVQVGAIKRYGVAAAVLEGSYPPEMLLGMTFLQNIEISKVNGIMVLTSKF